MKGFITKHDVARMICLHDVFNVESDPSPADKHTCYGSYLKKLNKIFKFKCLSSVGSHRKQIWMTNELDLKLIHFIYNCKFIS